MEKTFTTIEEIQLQKEELRTKLHENSELLGHIWNEITSDNKPTTRGEMVTSIISKSITAFDAFMLARKLVMQYGRIFHRKKRK